MSVEKVQRDTERRVYLLQHDKFDEDVKVSCALTAQGQFHSPKTKRKALGFFINHIDDNERHRF